jgi:phosphoenolpyruvate---glycerone phosphotransferase subunit DhaK
MKKLLNDPAAYADQTLTGLCRAHPEFYRLSPESPRVVMRPDSSVPGRVGIVTGGGSGHLPVFTGYIGRGLLNACAIGDVFASPSADEMAIAMRAASGGAGVLRLYGNYGGDIMNFDMAGEMLDLEGITSTTVKVADDVASAPFAEREKRRGVAGMVYAFKIAGAAADKGFNLQEVTRLGQKAADNSGSMGVALSPCIVPMVGKPTFTLEESEMEIGMGIHGAIAKKIIPGLRTERTCFAFSGSRSICVETDDFWIAPSSKEKRFIHVAGIASPGLSSAPAAAQEAVALIRAQTEMTKRTNFVLDRGDVMPTVE